MIEEDHSKILTYPIFIMKKTLDLFVAFSLTINDHILEDWKITNDYII